MHGPINIKSVVRYSMTQEYKQDNLDYE